MSDRRQRSGSAARLAATELLEALTADPRRMTQTLAERLAATRAERGARPPAVRHHDDVAARLAAWGGARLMSAEGGRVALVERRIPLPPAVAARLARG